ncbi:MAG: dihydrodipicolinate reductase [Blastocatellia bacterium]|nr:dihydrodipicolinate reductase [Blastocatellia bacterium]MCS7156821.1 dihydrodipicolinate reductase [Blastocatellia bacterium]MCX7752779.1 dihydrodipicolinate reductase [Blastocatellia bacterium]MDW8167512.1 dihydrodipicolinate reductase [Acidobacteriota bacterium]MDW8256859.1 dihydrodipicolinate reductase [Acidobacteriota bacterium]
MPLRIIQYGVGPIGSAIVRLLLERAGATIIGAIDIAADKVGRDLGEIAGTSPLGVVVSDRADEVLARKADVVVHSTSSYFEQVFDQLLACVRAGSHVVSTCEELAYPFRKHPELARRLDEEAKANGVAVLGTGVNPGFVMDKLVLTLATVCQRIERVSVRRVVDASQRRLPLQRKIGAGMTVAEFHEAVEAGRIRHVGLPESVALIADGLGLEVETISETIEPILAEEDVTTEYLHVRKGQVAGVRQIGRGLVGDHERITLELQMYVGAKEPVDEIRLFGTPDLCARIPGGTHGDLATAAVVVNSIPLLVQASPGLRTVTDLPVRFAAAF